MTSDRALNFYFSVSIFLLRLQALTCTHTQTHRHAANTEEKLLEAILLNSTVTKGNQKLV